MSRHANAAGADVHSPFRQEFANEAARTGDATVYTANDIGKFAVQLDDGTLWRLASIGPTTWVQVGGGSTADFSDDATVQTTDATPATVATYPTVGTNHAVHVKATIWGRQSASAGGGAVGDTAKYVIEALFERTAGVLTSKDVNVVSIYEDNAAWDADINVDGTSIDVDVTGILNGTIQWRCQLEVSEHG